MKSISLKLIPSLIMLGLFVLLHNDVLAQNDDAQNKLELPNSKTSYGMGIAFNYPQLIAEKENGMYAQPGFGIDGYLRILRILKDANLHLGLQYNQLNYANDNFGGSIRSHNGMINIGGIFPIHPMPGTSFIGVLSPTYNLGTRLLSNNQVDSLNPSNNITNQLSNRLDLGITIGLEFRVRDALQLQITYNHLALSQTKHFLKDGAPSFFGLKLVIDFTQVNSESNKKNEMAEKLNILKNDTLYIIDRTCDNISKLELTELFAKHYQFSAFKILEDNEIALVQLQENANFFAVVGSYVPSSGDPDNVGIFLLGKDLFNLNKPYPYFTSYFAWDKCMTDADATVKTIRNFSIRLEKASRLD